MAIIKIKKREHNFVVLGGVKGERREKMLGIEVNALMPSKI